MPQFMLISHHSMEAPPMEFTPEMIQTVIQKYNNWAEKLGKEGRLKDCQKLREELGRNMVGFGSKQVVTDGPYAETKEVIGGYWVITAKDYDEAVKLASDCPTLEFGGRIEVRELEDMSAFAG